MNQEDLVKKLKKQRIRLNKERAEEEKRKSLKTKVSDVSILNRIDKLEKEISHRDLLDKEFRASLELAIEKRPEAKFRDLIDAADKMKKHLNIIDGVGQEQIANIMIVPTVLLQRDAPHILKDANVININPTSNG